MGLDTVLKRWFPVLLLGLIALAAYFQGAGVSRWVGSRFAVDPNATAAHQPPTNPSRASRAASSNDQHSTSGDAIIRRNPFDSVTGPLTKGDAGAPGEDTPAPLVDFSNPYGARDCSDTSQVVLIIASDEPSWSMAVIGVPGSQGKSQLRRVGDMYGPKRLWHIAWDRLWLQGDGELCQIRMFKPPTATQAPTTPEAAASAYQSKSSSPALPTDITSKIQRVGPTEFNVDRSVVDKILENQAELMRSARIVPEQENGKVVGIRLFGIRPDTLLGVLGLETGDRLESINGFNMASPEKALEAYARLRTANHLTVAINRRGKPTNIDFNIK